MNTPTSDDLFFVIDSNNLEYTASRLYGYVITSEVFTDVHQLSEHRIDSGGNGCYVFVDSEGNDIRITQDFVGSFGLYLYEQQDYFAISNNFWFLCNHLNKNQRILTENADYNDHLFIASLCSMSCDETPIKEIKLLPRDAEIRIDKTHRSIRVALLDLDESSVPINSIEALSLLDSWFEDWLSIINKVAYSEECFYFDLSGGVDSRILFLLLINSNIPNEKITLYSNPIQVHTYAEDLEIATMVASNYGLTPNRVATTRSSAIQNIDEEEMLQQTLYAKLGFTKQCYPRNGYYRRHHFCGVGGEVLRNYWSGTPDAFKAAHQGICRYMSAKDAPLFRQALGRMLERSFAFIRSKFLRVGRPIAEDRIPNRLVRDTQIRFHCGRASLESFLYGEFIYAPLTDKKLAAIDFPDQQCEDFDLLVALIFVRYQPELLDIEFNGNRRISQKAIEYARQINALSPYHKERDESRRSISNNTSSLQIDCKGSYSLHELLYTHPVFNEKLASFFSDCHSSSHLRDLAIHDYSSSFMQWIDRSVAKNKFHPEETIMALMSTLYSKEMTNPEGTPSLMLFFERLLASPPVDLKGHLFNYPLLLILNTARIDIKNHASERKSAEVEIMSDAFASLEVPRWFSKDGTDGYVIECAESRIKIQIKCLCDGNLEIALRGMNHISKRTGKRIPIWIRYEECSLNAENILPDECIIVCHDKPYKVFHKVERGDVLVLSLTWSPSLES